MVRLRLFRIRPFAAGALATLLASLARGGLMFVLVIWLQGIWLPLHGYDFSVTPLKAGIAMVPLSCGFLVSGPLCGMLSDRYGARVFATGGMIGTAVAFALFEVLPTDFSYWVFGLLLFCTGLAMACFGSANRAAVMNSLPPADRGAGAGLNSTFQNSGQVLSIGIFFTLMTAGLSGSLPANLLHGLAEHGIPAATAGRISHLPPVSTISPRSLATTRSSTCGRAPARPAAPAQQADLLSRLLPSVISRLFRSACIPLTPSPQACSVRPPHGCGKTRARPAAAARL
jgi:MFS family permease